MSEDIHKWTDGRYTLMFDEHTFFVFDNEKEERMTALETTERLNEQQDAIFKLQDLCGKSDAENAKLRIEKRTKDKDKIIEDNEQLKIVNARWLDKSLQDKQIRYDNPTCKELTRKYLQLKDENERLRKKIFNGLWDNCTLENENDILHLQYGFTICKLLVDDAVEEVENENIACAVDLAEECIYQFESRMKHFNQDKNGEKRVF